MSKQFSTALLISSVFAFGVISHSNQYIPGPCGVAEARSGCCSWHGGVRGDGCGCNDGTPLSSTCAPYYSCSQPDPEPVVTYKTDKETEVVPFAKKTEDDPTLEIGQTKVKQKGVNGIRTITYSVKYIDGSEVLRKKTSNKVTLKPITEIIIEGTKPKPVAKPAADSPDIDSKEAGSSSDAFGTLALLGIMGGVPAYFYLMNRRK